LIVVFGELAIEAARLATTTIPYTQKIETTAKSES